MVYPRSAVNVCSKNLLQLQYNDIKITPLEEPNFHIRAYDSSSRNPLRLVTLLVTLHHWIIEKNFHTMSGKLSYNFHLRRP